MATKEATKEAAAEEKAPKAPNKPKVFNDDLTDQTVGYAQTLVHLENEEIPVTEETLDLPAGYEWTRPKNLEQPNILVRTTKRPGPFSATGHLNAYFLKMVKKV